MKPRATGDNYDKIATWWQTQHKGSKYGVSAIKTALNLSIPRKNTMTSSTQHADLQNGSIALDVGCGSGGRLISLVESYGYKITGVDVSKKMIELAQQEHPNHTFLNEDVCTWQCEQHFDFIFAWDSLFHLPLSEQPLVLNKLCSMLKGNGTICYTFGDDVGEHEDEWRGERFSYSSIGIGENIALLMNNGLTIMHLELDQYPEKHVFVVASKRT
ncbi:class I SAM-dependent methyltransferase [Ningiella sp. W23]|uniref:class I SAM-dependent methyltransferase n=1 Tax=Ningiella sp. W23 TaxID=3023715 RepID=UPI00375836B8